MIQRWMMGERRFAGSILFVLSASCTFLNDGWAQDKPVPARPPVDLSASVEISAGYDDNVFATSNDKVEDGLWRVIPKFSAGIDGETLDVRVFGNAEAARYWSESSEDYEDIKLGGEAGYTLGTGELFGGLSHAWEHEGRDSPDTVLGLDVTEFTDLRGHLGYALEPGPWNLRVGGTFQRLNFDDVATSTGIANNDDRDRDLYTLGFRAGHEIGNGWQVFGQLYGDWRDYEDLSDDFGRRRDSEGFQAGGGLRYHPGRSLDLEMLVGVMHQGYEDPGFDDVTTPDLGLVMTWRPGPNFQILASINRSIEETTDSTASGIIATTLGTTVSRRVRPDLSLVAGLDFTFDDYQENARREHILGVNSGLRYYLTQQTYLGFDYRFEQRDSTVAGNDYDNNQVFLNLGVKLDPAYKEADKSRFVEPNLKGWYLGTAAVLNSLGTELTGPRGSGGNLTTKFADRGFGLALFGGYGIFIDDVYLALEADAELSEAGWAHARTPGGRIFDVDKDWSVGIGPVAGLRLGGGSLLFGRFGLVGTNFESSYITTGGARFAESNTLAGLRVGGGAELPVTGGAFLRMDYNYTSYPDYDLGAASGPDSLANNESLVRIGVGYRFGSNDEDKKAEPTHMRVDGFYVGAQGGVGTLLSKVQGPRNAGSRLDVNFGDEGVTGGLFGGYGRLFGDLYLGVEVEGEIANQAPDHTRTPTGRTYSISKENTLGGGLRLGYRLGAAGMVYAKAGGVWTEFKTDYATTGANVSEDDRQFGWRVGTGAELPLRDRLFLRMDYTYTAYDSYAVTYGAGNTDSFDNSEDLFRVGVGWRF